MADTPCVVCDRRTPIRGLVCETDRMRIVADLTQLPGRVDQLAHHLVRGVVGDRTPIRAGATSGPPPLRVDTLSLTAAGSPDVEWMRAAAALTPSVRTWTTTHIVLVETIVDGRVVEEERVIVERHRDGGDLTDPGDQVGILPPAEWLDMWVRRWRHRFGHHVPTRARTRRARPRTIGWWLLATNADAARITAWLTACAQFAAASRKAFRARHLTGTAGYVEPADRPDDPHTAEWQLRFGPRPADTAVAADVRYLLTWAERACDEFPDIGDLAAELRTLIAELDRVVGATPDLQWLGRCPTTIIGRSDGTRRPCGAGLWQEPHVSQVKCPRCHSTWGPGARQILALAREIRTVWPVDRRRRYTTSERDLLAMPKCPTCDSRVTVTWSDVTGRGDQERWWQVGDVCCRLGCPDVRRCV